MARLIRRVLLDTADGFEEGCSYINVAGRGDIIPLSVMYELSRGNDPLGTKGMYLFFEDEEEGEANCIKLFFVYNKKPPIENVRFLCSALNTTDMVVHFYWLPKIEEEEQQITPAAKEEQEQEEGEETLPERHTPASLRRRMEPKPKKKEKITPVPVYECIRIRKGVVEIVAGPFLELVEALEVRPQPNGYQCFIVRHNLDGTQNTLYVWNWREWQRNRLKKGTR